MQEQRKQDVAKEYIENNILNKDLLDIQWNILWELNSLKENVESSLVDIKSILWSEEVWQNEEIQEKHGINLTERVMKILFNEKWEVKSGVLYNITKYFNWAYYIIWEKWREKLDLLRENLNKSKTEQELRNNLNNELNQLENDVLNPWNSNWWNNQWWYENLSSVENRVEKQVSEQYIYKQAKLYWVTDNRQIAYILAIVKWECGFKNIKEIWWENKNYWQIDTDTWKAYYGRWFLQLTHRSNYKKYSKIIRESWLNFRDNNGNIIMWSSVDLEKDPDLVLNSNDLASFILIDWMKNWWPYRQETKKLSHYINNDKVDFFNARYIINWDKNNLNKSGQKIWNVYKWYAEDYLWKLWNWNVAVNNIDNNPNNILIDGSPELLATNKDQIWWLWNSMMTGFQWYYSKDNFPNMDWVEWKNTQNHPRRFNNEWDIRNYLVDHSDFEIYLKNHHKTELDENDKEYLARHSNIKSFMFYFWANTTSNNQTLSDIENRSKQMQKFWVQPVLCTCIWEDNHPHLTDLNRQIIEMWKNNNWPVMDFAWAYNKQKIAMWDNLHPTGKWYTAMAGMINDCLVA